MELRALRAVGFRNLGEVPLMWQPGANLVLGPNGHGKTNLLEAISVLGNLRSFRGVPAQRLARHGEHRFELDGEVIEGGYSTRLRLVVEVSPPRRRTLSVDGVEVSPELYLRVLPVVALSASDRELVMGEPRERRSFLDRFAFLLEPSVVEELRLYRRVLRQRNAGLHGSDDELDAWETGLAAAAAQVVVRRRAAIDALGRSLVESLSQIAPAGFPSITAEYRTEAWLREVRERSDMEQTYAFRYNTSRARDRRMGHTVDGPHRHDIALKADGRPVRGVLSSGQTKVVAAALRLAMLSHVERETGRTLPVVIDDVDAELDRTAMTRLIRGFGDGRQVFLSSARGDTLVEEIPDGASYWIHDGCRLTGSQPRPE